VGRAPGEPELPCVGVVVGFGEWLGLGDGVLEGSGDPEGEGVGDVDGDAEGSGEGSAEGDGEGVVSAHEPETLPNVNRHRNRTTPISTPHERTPIRLIAPSPIPPRHS